MGLIIVLSLIFTFNEKLLSQRVVVEILLSSRKASFKRSRLNGIGLLKRLIQILRHFPKRSLFKGSFLLFNWLFFKIRFGRFELNTVNSVFGELGKFVSRQWVDYLNEIVESEGLRLINAYFAALLDFSFFEHLVHIVRVVGTVCFVDKPSLLIRRDLVLRDGEGISYFVEVDVSVAHSRVISEQTLVGNHFLITLLVLCICQIVFEFQFHFVGESFFLIDFLFF